MIKKIKAGVAKFATRERNGMCVPVNVDLCWERIIRPVIKVRKIYRFIYSSFHILLSNSKSSLVINNTQKELLPY